MNKKSLILLILLIAMPACTKAKKPYFNMPWGYFEAKDNEVKPQRKSNIVPVKQKIVIKKAPIKTKTNKAKPTKVSKKIVKNKVGILKPQNKIEKKDDKTIIIAARNAGSESYKIAGKVCEHINKDKSNDLRCLVEPVSSIKYALINEKNYDFIVSKTSIEALYTGNKNLKSAFSLYPESLTLIGGKDAKISKVSDLKGKTVFMANNGNDLKIALSRLLSYHGMSLKDVKFVQGFQMGQALCNGQIDAIFADINHPNADIDEFIHVCGVNIIDMQKDIVAKLVRNYDEYIAVNIAKSLYENQNSEIYSFGVMTNLIATSRVKEETVYKVVKSVFNDLQKFKISDKALLDLTKQEMVAPKNGLMLEIHPGAMKYYKETRLKK